MKKFSLLILSVLLLSCSSDNGSKYEQNFIKTVEAFAGNNCVEATLNQGLW